MNPGWEVLAWAADLSRSEPVVISLDAFFESYQMSTQPDEVWLRIGPDLARMLYNDFMLLPREGSWRKSYDNMFQLRFTSLWGPLCNG